MDTFRGRCGPGLGCLSLIDKETVILKKSIGTAVLFFVGLASIAWGSENLNKGVPGLDWKQSPTKSVYKLERDERLKDVESYYPINPFSYPREGVFKVYLDGMPNTKPVYWFYKKQFAELQLYDLEPERSLASLRELYGQPTKIIRNETPDGIQQWDRGKVLIEYVRFANDKATIWVKYKELSKKFSGN